MYPYIKLSTLSYIFVFLFVLFPFLGFIFRVTINADIYFISNMLVLAMALYLFFLSYAKGLKLQYPSYLVVFTIFIVYLLAIELLVGNILTTEAPFRKVAEKSLFKYYYTHYFLSNVFILFLIENLPLDTKLMKKATKGILVVLMISLLVTLIQQIDPLFFVYIDTELTRELLLGLYKGRAYSIYTWIRWNAVGFGAVSLVSIIYGMSLAQKKPMDWILIPGLIISFLSQARWAMLNFVLIIFQRAMTEKDFIIYAVRIFFTSVIAGLAIWGILQFIGIDVTGFVEGRVMDESADTRFIAFDVFANQFPKSPIWGSGGVLTEDAFQDIGGRSSQIHVGFLSILYYYGIVGTLIYIVFLYMLFKRMAWVGKRTNYWGSYFAMHGYILANCTLVHLDLHWEGLILALIYSKYYEMQAIDELNTTIGASVQGSTPATGLEKVRPFPVLK